jgi:hypothetical protein
MISVIEKIPIVLYDTNERRGYFVSGIDAMLDIMQHRHSLDPFEVNNIRVDLCTNVSAGSSPKKVLLRNENIPLSDDGMYMFKHAIYNIFSIIEDLYAKTLTRKQDI